MNNSQLTKKQHFVPQFYLKNFADSSGSLYILNLKEKRMSKPRPYQGLGYEYFYYAIKTGVPDKTSQKIEQWLKLIEDFISNELPKIILKIENYQQVNNNDRYLISLLMSMLWLRTPGMRTRIKESNKNFIEQMKGLAGDKISKKFESNDNINHIKLLVGSLGFFDSGFTNMFFAMKWKAYLALGNENFVTSDSPIVEKWLPPEGIFGASFLERDKYFALTPKILLHLTYPMGSTKLKRKTLYAKQDDIVKSLNMIIVSGGDNYAYSGDKYILEKILSGRKNPGKLEIEYIEKYEMPWFTYRTRIKSPHLLRGQAFSISSNHPKNP